MAEKGDAGDADDAADEEGDGVRLVEHVQRDLVHLAVIHRSAGASPSLSQSQLCEESEIDKFGAGISVENSSCYCDSLIPEVSGQRLRLRGGRHPRLRQHSPRRGLGPRAHGE